MLGRSGTARVVIFSVLFILASVFLLLNLPFSFSQPSPTQPSSPQVTYGPNWEASCSQGSCTATLYPYNKYYLYQGTWTLIDENIGTENCLPASQYCVDKNVYQSDFSANLITVSRGQNQFSLEPVSISHSATVQANQSLSLSVTGNQISYQNIFPDIDLRYTYLPEKLKEEFIVRSLPASDNPLKLKFSLPQNVFYHANNQQIQFPSEATPLVANSVLDLEINGSFPFFLDIPIVYDANGRAQRLNFSLYQNPDPILEIVVPSHFLQTAAFPITIDPTISLNDSNSTWDGHVDFDLTADAPIYSRTNNPSAVSIGRFDGISSANLYRATFEFSIAGLPASARVQSVNLTLFVLTAGNQGNSNVTVRHMERNNTQYDTLTGDCQGNCMFYQDMANGTLYNNSNMSAGFFTLNLTLSNQDMGSFISSGRSWIGYGFSSPQGETGSGVQTQTQVAGKSNANATRRPVLTITYEPFANETGGRGAIETGIRNSLGQSQPIQTDQKIYLVNQNGQHLTGSFDKASSSGNQSWAFNYNTTGETFTNIPSVFRSLNIWENQSLTSAEITSQVESLMNQTKV